MASRHDCVCEQDWARFTRSQKEAFLHKLWVAAGGDSGAFAMLQAIQRGELGIELRDLLVKLVDQHGRPIPPAGFGFEVVDANRQFYHVQPEINYQAVLARLQQHFDPGMVFMTAQEFGDRSDALLGHVGSNGQMSNLLKAPHFPVVIPQWQVGDQGRTIAQKFRPAAERSYRSAFPQRTFYDYLKDEVVDKVRVMEGTRHDQLVTNMAQGAVVGIYFPCLQGFGIEADRAMIKLFPDGFLLSGAIDTATAMAAYPEALARDNNTPVLDCAACEYSSGLSLDFIPDVDDLRFRSRSLNAYGHCAGGVLFVG